MSESTRIAWVLIEMGAHNRKGSLLRGSLERMLGQQVHYQTEVSVWVPMHQITEPIKSDLRIKALWGLP